MARPLSPAQLHLTLDVAPSVDLRFSTEAKLNAYRAQLYQINAKGTYAYRTRRQGLKLTVLRMG